MNIANTASSHECPKSDFSAQGDLVTTSTNGIFRSSPQDVDPWINKSVGSNKQFPHWDSIAGSLYMLHMDMELVWVPVAGNMLPSNPCKTSAYKRKQLHLVLSVCICLFLYIYFFISYYFLFIISHFSITLNMFDGFSYQGWSTSVRICQSSFAYFPLWPYIWN